MSTLRYRIIDGRQGEYYRQHSLKITHDSFQRIGDHIWLKKSGDRNTKEETRKYIGVTDELLTTRQQCQKEDYKKVIKMGGQRGAKYSLSLATVSDG